MKVSTLLEAGAIVPVDAAAPEGMALDTVSARTYRSPILGDRPIVRLTLDSLAPGDDLAMEFLGLGAPEVTDPLGLQRRRALGFPGWALVNDPEHAGFALEVVKELKKHARRAASKPGHAKEGLDDIGDRLGRSVPHFLPSYYEEVGRIFIETGNVKYGAQAFNKAREAENVHALEVDESLRLETFLEFALSGALAVKSLSSYAKELSKGYDPLTAYTHFRTLCVRRTLGGIPPWAAMGKELRRLLKGTGLKVQEEEEKLVEEILGASCLTKAPNAFWKHYQKALTALCRRSAEARGTLLNLFPSAPVNYGSTNEGHVSFFEILSDSGALEALYAEDASTIDAQAGPKGGAAAWLQKALNTFKEWPWYTEKNPAPYPLFEVIEKMAPRLLSDGVEVEPWRPGRQTWQRTGINIEATDLLLELGVPVADPPEKSEANLANWTKLTLRKPAEHRRDLHHLAQDPRFDDLLAASLDGQFGHAEFEEAAKGVAGLADARRKWVEAKVATLTESALVNFESTVERVCNAKAGITTEEFPNLYTRIGACNVAEVLARTWSLGVPDELGWPELDETCEALEGEVTASGAFPYLVVANKARAVVLGPEGEEARFELKVPAKAEVKTLRYIDGQLFVAYQEGWERSFYWSGSPEVIGDYPHYFWDKNHSANALGLAVTGGGIACTGYLYGDQTSGHHPRPPDGGRTRAA